MTRDLTQAQFAEALRRYGLVPTDFGYVNLAPPVAHISVCLLNGGKRRRGQLAYLLESQAVEEAQFRRPT